MPATRGKQAKRKRDEEEEVEEEEDEKVVEEEEEDDDYEDGEKPKKSKKAQKAKSPAKKQRTTGGKKTAAKFEVVGPKKVATHYLKDEDEEVHEFGETETSMTNFTENNKMRLKSMAQMRKLSNEGTQAELRDRIKKYHEDLNTKRKEFAQKIDKTKTSYIMTVWWKPRKTVFRKIKVPCTAVTRQVIDFLVEAFPLDEGHLFGWNVYGYTEKITEATQMIEFPLVEGDVISINYDLGSEVPLMAVVEAVEQEKEADGFYILESKGKMPSSE